MHRETSPERIERAAAAVGFGDALSRRGFLRLTVCAAAGVVALGLCEAWGADAPLGIIENAKGMLLIDPTRCVGCQRCELACVEFNDGRAQPSLSRIKVDRALHFGAAGATGGAQMQGAWGNGLVAPGVCRQCPHPTPCVVACPYDAIAADSLTGARVVDEKACVGCRLCQRACPWGMLVFDEEKGMASKCFLCHGRPKCVEACPAEALRFVAWRDTTRESGARFPVLTVVPQAQAETCGACHVPIVSKKTVR